MGLYKRPRSKYWQYSLQIGGRRVYKSTGETDRNRARLLYFQAHGLEPERPGDQPRAPAAAR